jgi:hypothetical protein
VTPIYGVKGAQAREIEFLSSKYMELLEHAAVEAKRHGKRLAMATGTGWPFGGPWVTPEDGDARFVRDDEGIDSKPTGMKVKRASPGGAGLVLNPFSPDAMTRYLRQFDNAFGNAKFPNDPIRCQFHDSFEYQGNWSPALLDRFKASRGYDLRDQVAAFFGQGDADTVARVKYDYRLTLDEAHAAYMKAWVDWCHQHGWKARNQAHGSPGNLLDLYAGADIPETETFGSTDFPIPLFRREPSDVRGDAPQPLMARMASSAAHVTGKPLVSCETFTWLREHFRATPAMMKPEVDQMFLCGINHVLFHGTCFSPADAAWPGWQFYASVEFAPQMPIWRDLPAMNGYIARCQSVLQAGQPDNDVLVYWPISDLWMEPGGNEVRFTVHSTEKLLKSSFGKVAQSLIAKGYACDFISDHQLAQLRGGRYRTLVIPECRTMPLDTAQRIMELSRGGMRVVLLGVPQDVPGFKDHDERRKQLQDVSKDVTAVSSLDDSSLGVSREPMVDDGLSFIRRAIDGGHVYFIANLGGHAIHGPVQLTKGDNVAVLLDPLTRVAGTAPITNGRVLLQLASGQSIIVRTFDSDAPQLPAWRYTRPAGEPTAMAGTWEVSFIDGGPSLPAPLKFDKLVSWTEGNEDAVKAFSGTARYRLEFDAPQSADSKDWLLDLGDVRESAHVTLNGQSLGTLWSLPFRMRVGEHLKPGRNVLEVEVTNLAANRVRDLDQRKVEWRIMKEINFVNINYKPFDAANWPLAPSGLLGPVTLTPLRDTTSGAHD